MPKVHQGIRKMKTYKHLYEPMLEDEAIVACFHDAAKHKTQRKDVRKVLDNLDENTRILKGILEREEFLPSYHVPKIIRESSCKKERRIVKPNYKYEQVVGHCIIRQFKPVVLDGFYEFSCGSIPGRGCHSGKKWMRKWIDSYEGKKFYVLKMDIRRFFDSIDRLILKQMLADKIKDDRFLRLVFELIEYDKIAEAIHILGENRVSISLEQKKKLATMIAYDRTGEAVEYMWSFNLPKDVLKSLSDIVCEMRHGVPLGYYTSQWFGNFVLKNMDHWIKQELGAEHYMRYMDDMVILGRNKKKLHSYREQIDEYLHHELHLQLKDNWQIFRFEYATGAIDKNGKPVVAGRVLDFMGFQFHFNRTTLRKSTLRSARRKAKRIAMKKKISWYESTQMLSYMGSIDAADVYDYYERHIKPFVNVKKLKKIVSKHSRRLKQNGNSMAA